MALNKILPKVETTLKNENRLFDCSFYNTIEDAFEALQAFIVDSYSLNQNEKFSIQYEDDENDFITISTIEDFKDAIEEVNCKGEILKIYVILEQKNLVSQSDELMNQENVLGENGQNTTNDETKSNEKKEEKTDSEKKKEINNILNDLRNDQLFRAEVVSFVKTALTLFQKNNGNPDYDIASCVLTSLSSHERLMLHESFQNWIMNLLPLMTGLSQPFFGFLMNIDANKVDDWINHMINQWITNSQSSTSSLFGQHPFFSHFMNQFMSNNVANSANQQATTSSQPVISSSITNEFFDRNQKNNASNSFKFPLNIGNLFSTLLTPFHANNNNGVTNDDEKKNEEPSFDEDLKLCVIKDDETLCDEAVVIPKQVLIKTWRVKNIGKKAIKNGLYIQYVGNAFNPMVNGVKFPIIINNGVLSVNEETDIYVTIESPIQNGHYSSEWKIFSGDGKPFELLLRININVCPENETNEIKSDTIKENNKNGCDDFEKPNEKKNENVHNTGENIDPYGEQLELLLEMGFTNVDILRSLLASHNGLIDKVINVLS